MNSAGTYAADPKFPSSEEYSQGSYIPHSDYYNQHIQAAQHYGYGVNAAAAHGYPGARDPMGYGGYYNQCTMSPHQQESPHNQKERETFLFRKGSREKEKNCRLTVFVIEIEEKREGKTEEKQREKPRKNACERMRRLDRQRDRDSVFFYKKRERKKYRRKTGDKEIIKKEIRDRILVRE